MSPRPRHVPWTCECLDAVRRARRREPARRGATVDRALVGDGSSGRASASRPRLVTVASDPRHVRAQRVELTFADARRGAEQVPARRQLGASCSSVRSRRRTLLRTTAGPRARPSANATLGGDADGSRTYVHQSAPARVLRPSTDKRRKAARPRMRQIKPTVADGPCRDGSSAPRARPGCSSADGSRACEHDAGCWVGTCASRDSSVQALARTAQDAAPRHDPGRSTGRGPERGRQTCQG